MHCNFFPSKLITYTDWMEIALKNKRLALICSLTRKYCDLLLCYLCKIKWQADCLQNADWDWSSWSKTVERNRRWILLLPNGWQFDCADWMRLEVTYCQNCNLVLPKRFVHQRKVMWCNQFEAKGTHGV